MLSTAVKAATAFRDEDYALALVDGAFTKAIVVQLVRKVEGKQFFEVYSSSGPDDFPLGSISLCTCRQGSVQRVS